MSPRRCFLCDQKAPKITLHKFPKNAEMCSLWKEICNLQDYDTVSSLYICSDHFTKDDYREPKARVIGGVLQIKPGSYPSVNVPKAIMNQEASTSTSEKEMQCIRLKEELLASTSTREEELESIQIKEEPTASTSTSEEEFECIQVKEEPMTPELMTPEPCKKRKFNEPRYLGEVTSSDFASPGKAERVVLMAKRKLAEQHKKYLSLKQKTYGMEKKIESLQSLVDHLKQRRYSLKMLKRQ